MIRTHVYVDGFNLYYGAVRGTPFRWLNIVELVRRLLPHDHIVDKVKYFTARVSGAADPDAPRRQQIYLSAISTFPEVELHFGRFLAKAIWRPVLNLPIAGATVHCVPPTSIDSGTHQVSGGSLAKAKRLDVGVYPPKTATRAKRTAAPRSDALIAEVHAMEEKGSDVNLAAHLLNDAWKNLFDAGVVISNDTDLVTPIRMVTVERQKPVFVVCPGRWQMSPHLERVATYRRHIQRSMLAQSQLPDPIPSTTIRKPLTW